MQVIHVIIIYIILLLALLWEVPSDLYRIRVKKKPDNHKQDLLPRFLLCVVSSVALHFLYHYPLLPGFIYSVCLFAALFDPIMGLALHGDPLYKSPDSKTDQMILNSTPPWGEVFARLWILSVGIGCFYHWDLVIGR